MQLSLIFVAAIWTVSPSTIRGMPLISPAAAAAATMQVKIAEALAVTAIRQRVSNELAASPGMTKDGAANAPSLNQEISNAFTGRGTEIRRS
jgi:hypothetical protein